MPLLQTKQRLFSYLIGEVYEASQEPAHWQNVLRLIARMTGSDSASLAYCDQGRNKVRLAFSTGWSEPTLREYNESWGKLDPMFELNRQMVPIGVARACHQMVPDREELESRSPEFYDWFKKHGGYYIARATLFKEGDQQAAITLHRGRQQGRWSNRRMQLLTELMPHIQRAVKIQRRFARLETQANALQTGLDKMVMGVVLFDRHGPVVHLNPMANAIIRQHPAVKLHGDRLIATHPEDGRRLSQLLALAAQETATGNLEPRALGLRCAGNQGILPVLVTAVKPVANLCDPEANRIRAAMYFSDPMHSHPMSPDTLVEAYGLTAAEAWVAIGIANGLSVEEVAEQGGTSINTARSQLRSIFRKTETSRQTELVKLLLTGPFCISS